MNRTTADDFRKKVRKYSAQIATNLQSKKSQSQKEQKILTISVCSAAILAVFGIIFGIFSKTQAIIFDGLVAFISVGLGYLSVATSRFIYKDDDDIFQYGYVRFEPMVNLFKALILLILCVYAFISAIRELFSGGYAIETGAAAIYNAFALLLSAIMFGITRFYGRILESDLIKVDNLEWKIDCVLYVGGMCAFGLVFAFDRAQENALSRLIDPALLFVLSLYLSISPLKIAIANFKDLVMVAPPEMDNKITEIMENLATEYGFGDYDTHIAKSGRFFMIEVNILLDGRGSAISSVKDCDVIREKIEKALELPSYKIWLSVSFTSNPKWL